MSTQGYSVMLNTFSRTHFNMGADSGVSYTMESEDSCMDYYMICSRDYQNILEQYTALTGRSPMIPRWAFGFWMSKMSYLTQDEVEQTVDRMASFGMSADVIHVDAWGEMFTSETGELLSFDEKRFPDPQDMIRSLADKEIHLSQWMFPYVHELNRDGTESKVFTVMRERDFLVKNRKGEVYTFTPGEGDVSHMVAALDFTNPALVDYMTQRVGNLMRMGVGVIKTDFSEEIPEDAVFYDGTTGAQSHNRYPLLYAKTIYEASRAVKETMGQKALLWGRSGYLGSQNYPANWAGDSSASLNNLASILAGGLSIGISGVSFWGFDIGGFYNCDYEGKRTVPEDEEYIRSVQMGLMSPLSRSHGQATPREPWIFSETAQAAFLKINKLRYRLLPYLYSTAYETHNRGISMMRALLLEFPQDRNVRTIAQSICWVKRCWLPLSLTSRRTPCTCQRAAGSTWSAKQDWMAAGLSRKNGSMRSPSSCGKIGVCSGWPRRPCTSPTKTFGKSPSCSSAPLPPRKMSAFPSSSSSIPDWTSISR